MNNPENMSIEELQMEIQKLELIEKGKRLVEAEKLAGQITGLLREMMRLGFPVKTIDSCEDYVNACKVGFDDDTFYINW